jgi:hypothetical protein
MLNAVVVMLNAIMLGVVMLNVVAPRKHQKNLFLSNTAALSFKQRQ